MKRVPLHNQDGQVVAHALVDDDDFLWVNVYSWFLDTKGYARRSSPRDEQGKQLTIRMAREIAGCVSGDGIKVDHWNRDKLDNQRHNLRVGTHAQNHQNRAANGNQFSSSRYRGVHWNKFHGKWVALAKINGKQHHLGYFDDEDEAGSVASDWRLANMPWAVESGN